MNRFLQLGANKNGRDFVIGDIHGKYDELMYGLDQVCFDWDNDRLIAVGDLIDRGTQNMKVLGLIGEPWFYTVIGNHEMMMFDAIVNGGATRTPYSRDYFTFWTSNGGAWYYTIDNEDMDKLKDVYCPLIWEHLPVVIEFIAENGKRIGVTHAGTQRGWGWDQTRKHMECITNLDDRTVQECLWTRTKIQDNGFIFDILGVDLTIHGHTPSIKEVWRGNTVFIDLGMCNGGKLNPINVMDLLDRQNKNEHYAWKE